MEIALFETWWLYPGMNLEKTKNTTKSKMNDMGKYRNDIKKIQQLANF